MSKVTITITTREGTIAYLGRDGKTDAGNWRLLKKSGKGTRPVPRRLLKRKRANG